MMKSLAAVVTSSLRCLPSSIRWRRSSSCRSTILRVSSFDSVYGARPIKRFIQSRVETLIAKAIIQGSYPEGATLTVDYDGTSLVLR